MIFLELFWSFLKIGFTSFGGMSMVPLINSEMIRHGWMTVHEVSDILAIAEMTPGPNGLNCAIFAGLRVAGLPGCLSATLGVLSPTLSLGILAAFMFSYFKSSSVFQKLMAGVRPGSLALIVSVIITMFEGNYFLDSQFSIPAFLLGLFDLYLLVIKKTSIIKVICLSGLFGIFLFS